MHLLRVTGDCLLQVRVIVVFGRHSMKVLETAKSWDIWRLVTIVSWPTRGSRRAVYVVEANVHFAVNFINTLCLARQLDLGFFAEFGKSGLTRPD